MSNHRIQKKQQKRLNRAAPKYPPGGATMYVPAGYAQSTLGQTFYGSTTNIPTGQTPLFSPGVPLPPQPGVNPGGKTVQWRYPISWNSFAVDRTLGDAEKPSFETLRRLAKMYSGITLNERYWLDLVPRMKLEIRLKKVFADAGAEIKNYQKEQATFLKFWEKPDGVNDQHSWLRMMLREQSQIDELYLYKDRTRGRKMLGYLVTAGDQMKPLLDDWGRLPKAPGFAFQQYPWGIPGMQYSTDMMIHYQETPAADSPFGFSRVERFILETNQALRKKKKDLANFTEGNIPQSFMEVPESPNWTPDQIDAFEQSWNALLAGNLQQQVRIKFLQPGMKYIPAEQYEIGFEPDLFLFKIACGCYGVPVSEFSFTDTSNRSTGESQEDMVYRRTIDPIALSYARIMTQCMAEDFPEELHGEMFEACFTGYEEVEDEEKKAISISTYTNAGILGLTDAAKLAGLPIDPEAPPIGRVVISKTGPIFLDDMATPEMRQAQQQATMAGFQLAANPPAPDEAGADDEDEDEAAPPAKKQPPAKAAKKPPQNKAALNRLADALGEYFGALLAHEEVEAEGEEEDDAPLISRQGSCSCEVCTANAGKAVDAPPPYHEGCDCSVEPGGSRVQRASSQTEAAARHRAGDDHDHRRAAGAFDPGTAAARAASSGTAGLHPAHPSGRALEDDGNPKALAASASASGGSLALNRSAWKPRW